MYLDIFISLYLYIFLFSDGWADRTDVIQGLESAAIGKNDNNFQFNNYTKLTIMIFISGIVSQSSVVQKSHGLKRM